MKFAIITHVEHKIENHKIFAYEPYVREMNMWLKYVESVKIIAPTTSKKIDSVDTNYIHNNIQFIKTTSFNLLTFKNTLKTIYVIPSVFIQIYKGMKWADHIHVRCPGNVGLLGCLVQIGFPKKSKTFKYAGNWDPKSKQPLSYRLQKWILSNTFLTRNAKVLVYGEWPKQSKNILPFFTATYSENEIKIFKNKQRNLKSEPIRFIFAGTLSKGKRPLLTLQVINMLLEKGHNVKLDLYGEGEEREKINRYIIKNKLEKSIQLHGNVSKEKLKEAYQKGHFLLFFSKSEGWPKVVAEAMFWGCIPISSNVSCIPYMLGDGKRGSLIKPTVEAITDAIELYLKDFKMYIRHSTNGQEWSRKYTTNVFEAEIKKLI